MPERGVLTEGTVDHLLVRVAGVGAVPGPGQHGGQQGHQLLARLIVDAQVARALLKLQL